MDEYERRTLICSLLQDETLSYTAIGEVIGVTASSVRYHAVKERERVRREDEVCAEAALPFVDRRVALLPLRQRTRRCLASVGIIHGRDLLQWTEADLCGIEGFSDSCEFDVRSLLEDNGVELKANEQGQYPSVQAACRAKIKTPLQRLEHWWTKATPDEREIFRRRVALR